MFQKKALFSFVAAVLFASMSVPVSAADPAGQGRLELAQARQGGPSIQETLNYLNGRCHSRPHLLLPGGYLFSESGHSEQRRVQLSDLDLNSIKVVSDASSFRIVGGCVSGTCYSSRRGKRHNKDTKFVVIFYSRLEKYPGQLKKCITAFKHLAKRHGAQDKELF